MADISYLSANDIQQYIDSLNHMLKQTVDNGASIGWIPPITESEASTYWQTVKDQVASGNKIMLGVIEDNKVIGSVQLGLESRENGNHRAEVQKLMVHTDYRRRGLAQQLMQELDNAAKQANRTLLVLDVRKGDAAETLYQKMGYTHVGDIPDYARSDKTTFAPTAFYYKQV